MIHLHIRFRFLLQLMAVLLKRLGLTMDEAPSRWGDGGTGTLTATSPPGTGAHFYGLLTSFTLFCFYGTFTA